jgi:hypothetical protein
LLQAARGEPALHVLKNYHRDHFFHVIEVCFLGHLLLQTRLGNGRTLAQRFSEAMEFNEGSRRIMGLWYLASLLHDVGYGVDVLKGVTKLLGFFKNSEALRKLSTDLENATTPVGASAEVRSLSFLGDSAKGDDHGVVGAIHLKGLLDTIAKDDSTVVTDDYAAAYHAIAVHNAREHDNRVSAGNTPLSFLLILCDQLQEWNRPRLQFPTAPAWFLAHLENGGAGSQAPQSSPLGIRAEIDLERSPAGVITPTLRTTRGRTPCLRFTVECGQPISRNSGVFNLWLDATCNFQRIDYDIDWIDVEISYLTPLYLNPSSGLYELQMHRLRDAARETHMTFLDEWFPGNTGTLADPPPVRHDLVSLPPNRTMERLTLNLRSLAATRLITKDIETFWGRIAEWRRYNEDREFPGDYGFAVPS